MNQRLKRVILSYPGTAGLVTIEPGKDDVEQIAVIVEGGSPHVVVRKTDGAIVGYYNTPMIVISEESSLVEPH